MLRLFQKQRPPGRPPLFQRGEFKIVPVRFANELYEQVYEASDDAIWRRVFLSWLCGGISAADAFLAAAEFRTLSQGTPKELTLAELRGVTGHVPSSGVNR